MPAQTEGTNSFRDSNTFANHFHGLYGNPGTNNVPCDPPAQNGSIFCMRGDDVFANLAPQQCGEYQYDIPAEHSPGAFWCVLPDHVCCAFGAAPGQAQLADVTATCSCALPVEQEQASAGKLSSKLVANSWTQGCCVSQVAPTSPWLCF